MPEATDRTAPQPERKAYATPALRVYGTIAAVTAAAGKMGTVRDGGPNNTKS